MRIDQLPVASTIGNTDTLPFSDGGITKQISVGNFTNSIRDDVYGAPLTASTSSAMTDTSRVYVYTGTTGGGFTNGHWYYYNGSAWTDGGIYNSAAVQTDPTLTLEGVPADAKATGELKTVIEDKLAEFDVAVETFYPHDGYNGPMVTVEGTVDAPPAELIIYGMSLQEGATPTPSAPVDIVTAGESGSIEMYSTNGSLFDPAFLLGASGWSVNGNVYSGDAYALWQQFNNNHWIPHVSSGTRLTIYGRASIPSAVSYPRFVFNYADGTTSNVNLTVVSEFVTFNGTSEINKDVDYITFTYSGSTSATMSLTDMRISIGTTDSGRDYIAPAVSDIPTEPNGLPGIPVASGGNYIDTGETRWICDTIDFKAGTWTKRCGIINSYNGETLPGVWMSSKDVYVSGNSPTTGATVVYALAAPLVAQLSEEQLTAIRALRGRNGQTVMYSTDPVPVSLEFLAEMYIDIPTYIQSLLNQMDRGFNVAATNNGLEFTSIE